MMIYLISYFDKMPIVNNKLQRPAEKLNISYGIEKITPEEDAKIKQWVNGKY